VQPHSAYRISEIEWFREVPEHWQLRRLAYSVVRSDVKLEPEQAEGLPYIGLEHVTSWTGSLLPLDEQLTPEGAANAFEIGDVLFGKLRPYLAKAWCADFGGVCSTEFLVLRPRGYEHRYLLYLLLTDGFISHVDSSTYGAKMPRANWDFIGDSMLPLPPLDEQRDIAAFLDRETERIDSLIAKKRLLIERLQEYRTALITRTVTRGLPPEAARAAGLDPSPRLKPSGVEWLGDVPEHWDVVANRRLFSERDERSPGGEGELLTVSHITGVTRRSEKPDVGMFMAESLEGYKRCYHGDLVVNTMWAWMGAAGTAKETGLVSPSYNVYTPNSRLVPRFVDMAYRSARYVLGITSESRGIWTSRLRLYPQQFQTLVTAVPPVAEQQAIVNHVNQVEERFQRMIGAVSLAIERLQEYRTALITAAVTGKIDVRDEVSVTAGRAE